MSSTFLCIVRIRNIVIRRTRICKWTLRHRSVELVVCVCVCVCVCLCVCVYAVWMAIITAAFLRTTSRDSFASVSVCSTQSCLVYSTATHITGRRDRTRSAYAARANGLNHCFTRALPLKWYDGNFSNAILKRIIFSFHAAAAYDRRCHISVPVGSQGCQNFCLSPPSQETILRAPMVINYHYLIQFINLFLKLAHLSSFIVEFTRCPRAERSKRYRGNSRS